MNLADVFRSVASKVLARVDIYGLGSNQHELNATVEVRAFFADRPKGKMEVVYFSELADPVHDTTEYTLYDARAKSVQRTGRSEWRLYYSGSPLEKANPGDLVVFADTGSCIYALLFQKESTWEHAIRSILPGLSTAGQSTLIKEQELAAAELSIPFQLILDELGVPYQPQVAASDEDLVVDAFGLEFPTTACMSEFARKHAQPLGDDADTLLSTWIAREEELFRALERVIVNRKLESHFRDVDEFVEYSLSVHNRRKSRMGHSLQNHLAEVFRREGLTFAREVYTEGKNKPDFLFPSREAYLDQSFPESRLHMLAAKATCKDRWRQVLTEADRVPMKHLCTLQPGISLAQTSEMNKQGVVLVVPAELHPYYQPTQQGSIIALVDFVDLVRASQQ